MIPRMTLTVKRPAAGTWVKGVFVPGTATQMTIRASVQPATKNDIEFLPEGRRNSKSYALFTDTRLNMVTTSNPDIITIYSEDFELMREEVWQNGLINHYKYIVAKIGQP